MRLQGGGATTEVPTLSMVLSPYELSTRSGAAMAAFLLADGPGAGGITTLLPGPFGDATPARAREAAAATPQYQRLIDAWRWTGPLWRSSLLRPGDGDASPLDEARLLCRRVEADPELEPLRSLLSAELLADEAAYLEAVSRDLLRGGGDPAISVPVEAGMAMYAARRGVPFVRAQSAGATRRVSATATSAPRLRVTMQVPTRGEGDELLVIREAMASSLAPVRGALRTALASMVEGVPDRAAADDAARAADAFACEFGGAISRGGALSRGGLDATLLQPAMVTITASRGPADADLRSAARALRTLRGMPPTRAIADAASTALAPAPVLTLTVRTSVFDAHGTAQRAASGIR